MGSQHVTTPLHFLQTSKWSAADAAGATIWRSAPSPPATTHPGLNHRSITPIDLRCTLSAASVSSSHGLACKNRPLFCFVLVTSDSLLPSQIRYSNRTFWIVFHVSLLHEPPCFVWTPSPGEPSRPAEKGHFSFFVQYKNLIIWSIATVGWKIDQIANRNLAFRFSTLLTTTFETDPSVCLMLHLTHTHKQDAGYFNIKRSGQHLSLLTRKVPSISMLLDLC